MTSNWQPTASIDTLRERARIVQQIRLFFEERGFWEVETPALSHDTVVDKYLEPIMVSQLAVGLSEESNLNGPMYLQTSPEFGMKRLLAAGADQIYQICKSFRAGEIGNRHNIEFTMLEWYEAGTNYESGMDRLAEFAKSIFSVDKCDRLTYREAFNRAAQIDPFAIGIEELRQATTKMGRMAEPRTAKLERDECLNVLMGCIVEPTLGMLDPVIISDWPASQSALAIVRREGEFEYAERFELYFRGIELANGYHELTDVSHFASRNASVNRFRMADGRRQLPADSGLLHAMESGMPNSVGVAFGVDRLVMLKLGLSAISEVIAFPFDRA